MREVQTILNDVLLALQLCLGFWQFVKLTPVGGLVQGGMGWLLSLLPFCKSTTYALLQGYPGRVFKKVHCIVLTKAAGSEDELMAVPTQTSVERRESIEFSYLGHDYELSRRGENMLFINGKISYYIPDAIWENLMPLQFLTKDDVFIKGCKDFWEMEVTGGVMTLSEALDCIILENRPIMSSDNVWLLPVNMTLSEEKLLRVLNLVGLFLQTKKVFWLFPTLLSFTSAILEFNTTFRAWLYTNINKVFCWSMHVICDKLPYSKRRQVYSLGNWVENLKPCNDIELRVVRGDICALIGGAAKFNSEDATLVQVPWLNVDATLVPVPWLNVGVTPVEFQCDPFYLRCEYFPGMSKCGVGLVYSNHPKAALLLDCLSSDEFMKICTFVDCVAKHRSGSLKSYERNHKVQVRGWKESVRHYVKTGLPPIYEHYVKCGLPPIYELRLEQVIVSGI